MTLASSTRYKLYQPVVATTVFVVPFPIFSADDLSVFIDGVENETFSVSASFVDGVATGATITLVSSVVDVDVEIFGSRAARRESNYLPNNPNIAENLQLDMDRLTAVQQEHDRDINSAISVSERSPVVSPLHATATERSSRSVVFSADGTGLDVGPTVGQIESAEQFASDAADAQAAAETAAAEAEMHANVFTSRSAFVTWWAANSSLASGGMRFSDSVVEYIVIPVGHVLYGTDPISDMPGIMPFGITNLRHFGAVLDYDTVTGTGTDDASAWSQLVAYMSASGQNNFVLDGYSLTSAPIVFNQFGVSVIHTGIGTSGISGSHTSGPVLQFRKSYCRANGLKIMATAARAAAAYNVLNAGIIVGDFDWTNPTVDYGSSGAFCEVEQNSVESQPGPGILPFGGGSGVRENNVQNCKGHGIHVDSGQELGIVASNLGFPGWMLIDRNKVEGCGGNGICVGDDDPATNGAIYRMTITNNDVNNNATDAAVRKTTHQFYLVGEQFATEANVANCGTNGPGMYVAGQQHTHMVNRFVGLSGEAYEVGNIATYPTGGITIDEFRVNGPKTSLDPAVVIDSAITAALGVRVKQSRSTNITNIVATADRAKYASVTYQGETDYTGGALKVAGRPVDHSEGTFTPTVSFSTAGDSSFTYVDRNGYYHKISDTLAFIDLNLNFNTNAYTTASGVLIVTLPSLPFSLDSSAGGRTALAMGDIGKLTLAGGEVSLSARANGADNLRITAAVSGSSPVSIGTTQVPASTSNIAFNLSGIVRIT